MPGLSSVSNRKNEYRVIRRAPAIERKAGAASSRDDEFASPVLHRTTDQRMMLQDHHSFTDARDRFERPRRIGRSDKFEDLLERRECPRSQPDFRHDFARGLRVAFPFARACR